jgi:hypothetical protein
VATVVDHAHGGEKLLAHATTVDQLSDVDGLLHDLSFSFAEINFDEANAIVTISFQPSSRTHDLFVQPGANSSPSGERLLLTVRHVRALDLEDPDELVEHSYARITMSGPAHLILRSNFHGQVGLEVTAVDVRVSSTDL